MHWISYQLLADVDAAVVIDADFGNHAHVVFLRNPLGLFFSRWGLCIRRCCSPKLSYYEESIADTVFATIIG